MFYALIHLGYVAYDIQHVRLYIPNKEVMGQIIAAIEGSNLDTIKESLKLSEQALDAVLNLDEEKVAEIVEKNHQDLTSAFSYDYEKSLSYVVHSTFVASYDRYFKAKRELPMGKGFADLVYLPEIKNNKETPTIVVELKWDQDAKTAIDQIKEKRYCEGLLDHTDNILMVGINYDKKTKKHTCKIEQYRLN